MLHFLFADRISILFPSGFPNLVVVWIIHITCTKIPHLLKDGNFTLYMSELDRFKYISGSVALKVHCFSRHIQYLLRISPPANLTSISVNVGSNCCKFRLLGTEPFILPYHSIHLVFNTNIQHPNDQSIGLQYYSLTKSSSQRRLPQFCHNVTVVLLLFLSPLTFSTQNVYNPYLSSFKRQPPTQSAIFAVLVWYRLSVSNVTCWTLRMCL